MGRAGQRNRELNNWWMGAFWFTGVALFMMELSAGLDYVEARLGELAPNVPGALPAWGMAAWKLAESTFWHYGQLEATFRVVSLVALPFALLGLAVAMKSSMKLQGQKD